MQTQDRITSSSEAPANKKAENTPIDLLEGRVGGYIELDTAEATIADLTAESTDHARFSEAVINDSDAAPEPAVATQETAPAPGYVDAARAFGVQLTQLRDVLRGADGE